MAPPITTQTTASLLYRLLLWIHLRLQPLQGNAILLVPLSYAAWLAAWIFEKVPNTSPPPMMAIKPIEEKKSDEQPIANGHGVDTVIIKPAVPDPILAPFRILFSLPSKVPAIRLTNALLNTLLLLLLVDSHRTELFSSKDNMGNLTFARVTGVYPDGVRIQVRYPNLKLDDSIPQQAGLGACKVLWREAVTSAGESSVGMWKDGPVLQLHEADDWIGVARLEKLWPGTSYQFRLAYPNSTFLAYPDSPLPFKTFPDPRMNQGGKFKFVASSGLRPGFPYSPFKRSQPFRGLSLLADRYFTKPGRQSDPQSCFATSSVQPITPSPVVQVAPDPKPVEEPVAGASSPPSEKTETCYIHGIHHPTPAMDPNPQETGDAPSLVKSRIWKSLPRLIGLASEEEVPPSQGADSTAPDFMFLLGSLLPQSTFKFSILRSRQEKCPGSALTPYRTLYSSDGFRAIYERIPVFTAGGKSSHGGFFDLLSRFLPHHDSHKVKTTAPSQDSGEASQEADVSFDTETDWDVQELYAGMAHYSSYGGLGLHSSFSYADSAFFVLDTTSYKSDPDVVPEGRMVLGESQILDLSLWLNRVNHTATFKFIVSSEPLTSLWLSSDRGRSRADSRTPWSTYAPHERQRVVDLLSGIPNVIVISGSKHSFAAIEYPTLPRDQESQENTNKAVWEFVTGPLSGETAFMWDKPRERVTRMDNVTGTVPDSTYGGEPETVVLGVERTEEMLVRYEREGSHKWSTFTIDTLTNPAKPMVAVELFTDGRRTWSHTIIGEHVPLKAAGTAVNLKDGVKSVLHRFGLNPSRWW